MRRIRYNRENENLDNVRDAFDSYSNQKHNRWNVRRYEEDLDEHIAKVLQEIIDDSFIPSGYQEKWIFDKKPRKLAKAPVYDHHAEAAHIRPYEQQVYDYISWRSPAVRPGLGTHALMRFLRNELYRCSQQEVYYYLPIDIHHYFPLMDHATLKEKVDNKFKKSKLRNFIYRVIDSYQQGSPLGIKLAQLFGMLYLADFDRLMQRFFDIPKDPEKMAYWTSRYITEWILTAKSPDEKKILSRGTLFLSKRFERFARDGLQHSIRFVDNILVLHEDKVFLRIVRELIILHLARDYKATVNHDYNIRPVWMGIRLCGYTFYHEHLEVSKRNKEDLARRIKRLRKKGYDEEQIRIKLSSQLGFVKHSDCINLLRTLGMEKSLGKIIKNRRIKPPFKGMTPDQKVPFSSLIEKYENQSGGKSDKKILLLEYMIQDSKIDKETVTVLEQSPQGSPQEIKKQVPCKALAIRFKKIINTFVHKNINGEEEETYQFEKKLDELGNPTEDDAEFYAFSGSRIMIDQALNDFSPQDLPAPTVIQQCKGADGKFYTKFT